MMIIRLNHMSQLYQTSRDRIICDCGTW